MKNDSFAYRFSKIFEDNKLSQTEASQLTGVGQSVISNLVNHKVVEKYSDFDNLMKICKSPEQRYYLATGEILPEQKQPEANHQESMIHVLEQMLKEIRDLKSELHALREEKSAQGLSQVRTRQKVPEHH